MVKAGSVTARLLSIYTWRILRVSSGASVASVTRDCIRPYSQFKAPLLFSKVARICSAIHFVSNTDDSVFIQKPKLEKVFSVAFGCFKIQSQMLLSFAGSILFSLMNFAGLSRESV